MSEEDSNDSEHLDRYDEDSSKLARTHHSKSLLQKTQGPHSSTSITLNNAAHPRKTLAIPSLGHAYSSNTMAKKSLLSGGPPMMDTITQKSGLLAATSNLAASQMTKQTTSNTAIDQKRKAREKQYEKIKEYAVKFNVDEAMIYSLLSEYKSMQKIPVVDNEAESKLSNDKKNISSGGKAKDQKAQMKKKQNLASLNMNKKQLENDLLIVEAPTNKDQQDQNPASGGSNQLISMKTYLHFSVFKRLLHAEVLQRIVQAFGKFCSLII